MKRSRTSITAAAAAAVSSRKKEDELSALELAAILNGDDPRRIGETLKTFVKVVRRERRLALGALSSSTSSTDPSSVVARHSNDNGPPSESESDQDDIADEQQTKKPKRFKASESWKEDTNQYDVPFVGTNVARGGRAAAAVVVGQWPTGLLQAYLERSTKAVEFTSDNLIPPLGHVHKQLLRQKQGKLSQAIYKSYLKALAELVTAAIPQDVLVQREAFYHTNFSNSDITVISADDMDDTTKKIETIQSDENPSFLAAILRDRVPSLLNHLQTETKKGKGPCGPLVPQILRILSNVAATSNSTAGISNNHRNARTLAREMEQSIPEVIWKAALRLPPLHHNTKSHRTVQNDKEDQDDANIDEGKNKKDSKREESRTAVLQLTRTLLSSKDSTVLHYIGSPGSKDRKLSAGLLVLALRDGLRDTFTVDPNVSPTRDAYYQEIVRLLQTVRHVLYGNSRSRNLCSTRRWVEIFSHDVLQNLADLSLQAPVLVQPEQYQSVLDATDTYSTANTKVLSSSLEVAGLEARRLLWPLLVDPKLSPLLQWTVQQQQQQQQLQDQGAVTGSGPNKQSGQNPAKQTEQSLVRIMGRLLDTHPAPGKLAWQHCLCYGMATTPTLLVDLFQKLTVPDPNRQPFAFLARLRFFSQVLQNDGVRPDICLSHTTSLGTCVVDMNVDPVVKILVPSALKKNVLSKAVQCKNAMVVSEALKFLICLVHRIKAVKDYIFMEKTEKEATNFWALLSAKVVTLLPELQVLLSVLSRFALTGSDRAAPVVCGHLCHVLLSYSSHLPDITKEVKFDWIKLLPGEVDIFIELPVMLQLKLLRTLEALLKIDKVSHVPPSSCELLLNIMTSARSTRVYDRAKSISQFMLRLVAPSDRRDDESEDCLRYEIHCWVECITAELVPAFCAILEEASQLHFKSEIYLLQAWKLAELPNQMPKLTVSPILMAAMSSKSTNTKSRNMDKLLNQVTTKCLLYHDNPLPLAALIGYFQNVNECTQLETTLAHYSKSLVNFEAEAQSTRDEILFRLVDSTFSGISFHSRILRSVSNDGEKMILSDVLEGLKHEDTNAATRQLLHMIACFKDEGKLESCVSILRFLLPAVLMGPSNLSCVLLRNVLRRLQQCRSTDLFYINLCVLSSCQETCRDTSLGRLQPIVKRIGSRTLQGSAGSSLLATREAREDLLSFLLFTDFLSFQLLDEMLKILALAITHWGSESSTFSLVVRAATACVEESLARPDVSAASGSTTPFSAWLSITDPLLAHKSSEAWVLASSLETLLCRQLASKSPKSAQLYVFTLEIDPQEVVERVFAQRSHTSHDRDEHPCLIHQLVECDPSRFAPVLAGLLFDKKVSEKVAVLWTSGMLDDAVLSVLKRRNMCQDMRDAGQLLVNGVVHRTCAVVHAINHGKRNTAEKMLVFHMVQLAERSMLSNATGKNALSEEIAFLLTNSMFHDEFEKMHFETRLSFLRAAMLTGASIDERDSSQHSLQQRLESGLFVRLCELLPRALRKTIKSMPTTYSSKEVVNPLFLIELLLPLTTKFSTFDLRLLDTWDSKCLASSLRACLKYGMAEPTSAFFSEVASVCLRLARSLLIGIPLSAADTLPSPTVVFEMIVSHSRFSEALIDDSSANGCQKLELVNLMLACSSLAKSPINIGADVWKILFRSYGASLNAPDCSLRRLFHVLSKRQSAEALPFLDQFRWKGMPENAAGGQSWDWLVNGLQLGRVRQTLRCFPLDDSLVPSPLVQIEAELATETISREYLATMAIKDTKTSNSDVAILQGTARSFVPTFRPGNDGSYSPGYVLPLILAALESCTGVHNCHQSSKGANPGMVDLARMAQRLCEKGGLSFALASLCCKCPALRQVAVSVICFFMWAVDSQEAREISSWRERPQLALLLHSVHRALVIRRAILMSREDNNGKKTPPESPVWVVPVFPGFSAIFLARSAFVLARPGESMFAPLNKFFLSIDSEHGAFRDMNRLPAFITFLCSSSDEPPDQARSERVWALKLFNAGFLDGYCFKMVAACHAPELLLTTLLNYRMHKVFDVRKQQDDECELLVQAVEIMIRRGGRHASHQLFGRIGLLSWLRSILESPAVNHILPTLASKISFLQLIATSCRHAVKYEADRKSIEQENENTNVDDDDSSRSSSLDKVDEGHKGVESQNAAAYPLEVWLLARPILDFCLESLCDAKSSGVNKNHASEAGSSIAASSLEALISIWAAFKSLAKEQQQSVRADGIELGSSLEYLSKISSLSSSSASAMSKAIDALTGLPMTLHQESCQDTMKDESAVKFSCRVLLHVTSASCEKSFLIQALTRLVVILESSINLGHSTELLQKILESRAACFEWAETRDLWFQLLSLSQNSP